ncbi:MAG: NAD(P)-binding domain-containing protein, partial [Chloroflexota bacterium]|nr:NAD(P)-binding domain-containing protein [Chloroflexota bacterium]
MGRTAARQAERIAVVGSGAWGTTLALVATRARHEVSLYVRNPDEAHTIQRTRRNERYLPQTELPAAVDVTADLAAACRDATLILLVVPSQTVRQNARALAPLVGNAVVVSAAKGLERESLKRMSEVVEEELGKAAVAGVCALSGPNLAREIAAGKPATSVVASRDLAAAERARDLLMSPQFRCYTNEDVIGV